MQEIIASAVLANGLRTDFADTYTKIRNRQADSRLAQIMDLGVGATNRYHDFAYFESAPYMEFWPRGSSIPTGAMDSVRFEAAVHNWAKRVPWHKDDRADDQTASLYMAARQAGEGAALLPELFFFDLLQNATTTLPGVPNAPDGAAFFSATDGASANRFGVSNGNLLSGSGIDTTAHVLTDYYSALEQFLQFQDTQGQPLLSSEVVDAGVVIIHAAADLQIMEEAFLQQRQGVVYGTNTAASTPSNIVSDASRNVSLWGTSRLASGDWYVFLKNAPTKPTFYMEREGLKEFTALEGDQNSDHVRDTGQEYIQWELRSGAGIALPYGAIKVNN